MFAHMSLECHVCACETVSRVCAHVCVPGICHHILHIWTPQFSWHPFFPFESSPSVGDHITALQAPALPALPANPHRAGWHIGIGVSLLRGSVANFVFCEGAPPLPAAAARIYLHANLRTTYGMVFFTPES